MSNIYVPKSRKSITEEIFESNCRNLPYVFDDTYSILSALCSDTSSDIFGMDVDDDTIKLDMPDRGDIIIKNIWNNPQIYCSDVVFKERFEFIMKNLYLESLYDNNDGNVSVNNIFDKVLGKELYLADIPLVPPTDDIDGLHLRYENNTFTAEYFDRAIRTVVAHKPCDTEDKTYECSDTALCIASYIASAIDNMKPLGDKAAVSYALLTDLLHDVLNNFSNMDRIIRYHNAVNSLSGTNILDEKVYNTKIIYDCEISDNDFIIKNMYFTSNNYDVIVKIPLSYQNRDNIIILIRPNDIDMEYMCKDDIAKLHEESTLIEDSIRARLANN